MEYLAFAILANAIIAFRNRAKENRTKAAELAHQNSPAMQALRELQQARFQIAPETFLTTRHQTNAN